MARLAFFESMEAEVTSLCGREHYPDEASDYQRAGSEKGVAYLNGEKEEIVRLWVREKQGLEVSLEIYQAASSHQANVCSLSYNTNLLHAFV